MLITRRRNALVMLIYAMIHRANICRGARVLFSPPANTNARPCIYNMSISMIGQLMKLGYIYLWTFATRSGVVAIRWD